MRGSCGSSGRSRSSAPAEKQMKAMASELNMYQAQVTEYKYEIERLSRELADVKRKFFEQKRREQLQREAAELVG